MPVTDNPRLQSHTAVTLAHVQASAVSWGPTPGLCWAANASHVGVGWSSADLSRPPPGSSAGLLLCLLTSHWPKQVTWLSPVLKGGAGQGRDPNSRVAKGMKNRGHCCHQAQLPHLAKVQLLRQQLSLLWVSNLWALSWAWEHGH